MLGKDIERKITVFISSKIDDRYKMIRHALKTLLIETGLVASVYVFEQEASSQDTQRAYLYEVSLSDLCIFLVDNADGVSDAVYKEHMQAINTGKHRLYFFCDESSKKEIPLHSELRQSGKTIYLTVSRFYEMPKAAYYRALQDILDWYRAGTIPPFDNTPGTQENSPEAGDSNFLSNMSFRLDKDIFGKYSSSRILTRVLNPYGEKLQPNENDEYTTYDNLCVEFLRTVIGLKAFNREAFMQLTENVLSEPTTINSITDVLKCRFDAIADYFSGEIDNCLTNLQKAYDLVIEKVNIPEWFVNDILIDLRNISTMVDQANNKITLHSVCQELLTHSPEAVYYPLLDRYANDQKTKLLQEHFEMLTESPYTVRMGIINGAFDEIASCFNIAVRFGSLTHIRLTRNRYADMLFTKYSDCKDVRFLRELIKMYILEQDVQPLKKVISAYQNGVDAITPNDIEIMLISIDTVPVEYKRFLSRSLLLEHLGYFMSEEQYQAQENIFFTQSNAWCTNELKVVSVGTYILRTALAILGRSDNKRILGLVMSFFSNGIWRFCDDALKVLRYINYKSFSEETQTSIMTQLIDLLAMDNLVNNNWLHTAIIQFRKTSTIDVSALDRAVEDKNPTFYSGDYDLEVGLHDNPQDHIARYMQEARHRIMPKEGGVYFSSFSYDPCEVIRSILKLNNIRLNYDVVRDTIALIQDIILNEQNQADAKKGALVLAIYLRNTYPEHEAWEDFSEQIRTHEANITNARFDPLFGESSPNVLRSCYLLLKISLDCVSFEEIAIGFAIMAGYSERDFISALKYLDYYLSDADVSKADNEMLGIILNCVLSVGEDKHSDALHYAVNALIDLLHAESYARVALERLSYLIVNANSNTKVLILRSVSETEYIKSDAGQHILQNGRTDNHYFVKRLANEITSRVVADEA